MVVTLLKRGLKPVLRRAFRLIGKETLDASGEQIVLERTRTTLAARYLSGSGLEIGALHHPLALPPTCEVRFVDRMSVPDLRLQYPELAEKSLVNVDIIDDGEKLLSIGESSHDFIIANHFIEHTQDPIGTIKRHLEVLVPGGVLYLAVPDKRWTFDRRRPVTTLEHLYRDHREGPAWSYMDHIHEWVSLVEGLKGEAFEAAVEGTVRTRYSIHFHVWTHNMLVEFLIDIRKTLSLSFDIVAALKNRTESIVILRKRPSVTMSRSSV